MTVRVFVLGAVLGVACVACQWLEQPRNPRSKPSTPALSTSPPPAASPSRSPKGAEPPAAASAAAPISAAPSAGGAAPEELPPLEPPAGTLPQPRPTDPPTHADVALGDIAKHVGETLRFKMKDGRVLVGTVRSIEDGAVKLERDMGLGTSAFRVPLTDVDQVQKRLP
jgi:hypothetical protein